MQKNRTTPTSVTLATSLAPSPTTSPVPQPLDGSVFAPVGLGAEAEATAVILAKSEQNLIWIDCEMSGLNPERDRLLEIAVVVTDPQCSVRVEGPVLVLQQSPELLSGMDAWNKGTHGKSGLIEKVKNSTLSEAQAEQILLQFLSPYVGKACSPMCGNTIGQDRRFLVKYMPKLEAYFHYRNIDVSTLKELAKRWKPQVADSFNKQQKHTALADVHESIDELLHYRQNLLSL